MTTVPGTTDVIVRLPMSWEEYLETDDGPYEYYGGQCVVSPIGSVRHQAIGRRLLLALSATVPDHLVVGYETGWSPAGRRELLGPDLMVFEPDEDELWFSGTPALVVEILSSHRRDDLVGKVQRYAAWGAPDYWIVDPRDRVMLTLRNDDGIFVETARVTGGPVVLCYGDVEVPLDVDAILGRAPGEGPAVL